MFFYFYFFYTQFLNHKGVNMFCVMAKSKKLFCASVDMLGKIKKVISSLNDNDDDIVFYIDNCEEKEMSVSVIDSFKKALEIIESAYVFA